MRKKFLHQIHGMVESFEPTTLDQIWGDKGLSKYGTDKEEEYILYLKELNKSDLQAHASQMGIVPIDNREMLTKRLLREFRLHIASYKKPRTPITPKKVSKEAMKILAEGR